MHNQPNLAQGYFSRQRLLGWCVVPVAVLLATLVLFWGRSDSRPAAVAQDQPAATSLVTEGSDDATLQRFWYAIVDLRNRCAVEGQAGWDAFLTAQARAKLDELNRLVWEEQADLGWSYFFARSLFEIGRPTSEAPLVGFYHPWSDVWLVTEWQVKPEPKVTAVELFCGEWIRRRGESPMDLRPDWLRRDGFRAEQLARAVVDNMQAFEHLAYGELPWRAALRLDEQQEVLDEINTPAVAVQLLGAYMRSMELMMGKKAFDDECPMPPLLGQLMQSCDRFLAAGSEGRAEFFVELAAGTSPAAAELIGSMPPEAYEQLAPAFWLADDDWAQAYLVPDQNPDSCLVLTYKRVADRLQLMRLDWVHFPSIVAARKQVDD